ncbi:MAG: hypothetical protein JRD89_02575 [Deltaproteobacteria bacterium]|nr:hypothetical protein [Deltaproteobacteria bacterium]
MLNPELILMIMLALQPAGRSIYSQTVVQPDAGPGCEQKNSLLCAEPLPNPQWDGQHTRPETAAEGTERYRMIATVIHKVAGEMTWKAHPRCQPASVARWAKSKADTECAAAWRLRPWQGNTDKLIQYLLAVSFNESGFRRDVHAGKGKMSRGDPDKQGRGQSWGLGQRKLGASGNGKTTRGWTATQLVGLDEQSTERAIVTIVDGISRGRSACRSRLISSATGPTCVFGIYGGIWAATGDERIILRVKTFHRIAELSKQFQAEQRAELGAKPPEQRAAKSTSAPAAVSAAQ